MEVKLAKDEIVETDTLSLEELEKLTQHVTARCIDITNQWEAARRQYKTTGEVEDTDWFNRVSVIRRKLNLARQQLVVETARRRKSERMHENAQQRIPYYFMVAAKEALNGALFEELMAEAVRRFDHTQAGWKVSAHYRFERE